MGLSISLGFCVAPAMAWRMLREGAMFQRIDNTEIHRFVGSFTMGDASARNRGMEGAISSFENCAELDTRGNETPLCPGTKI